MAAYLSHFIGDEHLVMSAERTLFWEDQSTLIVADVHVGKTGHFRKEGIGIPQQVYKDDLHRLLSQILFFKAERLVIVGDLTHSSANKELDLFRKWRKDFSSLDVQLVMGNHDILEEIWYEEAEISVTKDQLKINGFLFVHDILEKDIATECDYVFSGHIHPAITINGRGRQSLRFPCFYFGKTYSILPAFSRFTGTYSVAPEAGDSTFAVINKEVMPVSARR